MRRMIAAAAVALLVGCAGGYVLHGQSVFWVLGSGTISCGKWLQERRERSISAINSDSWVNGYLTGRQEDTGRDLSLTQSQSGDVPGRSAWIDQYCQSHPIDDLTDASRALLLALRAK